MSFVVKLFYWVLGLLLFVTLVALALINNHTVPVKFFLDMEWNVPLMFVVFGAFALGAVLGVVLSMGSVVSKRLEIGRLKREMTRVV